MSDPELRAESPGHLCLQRSLYPARLPLGTPERASKIIRPRGRCPRAESPGAREAFHPPRPAEGGAEARRRGDGEGGGWSPRTLGRTGSGASEGSGGSCCRRRRAAGPAARGRTPGAHHAPPARAGGRAPAKLSRGAGPAGASGTPRRPGPPSPGAPPWPGAVLGASAYLCLRPRGPVRGCGARAAGSEAAPSITPAPA